MIALALVLSFLYIIIGAIVTFALMYLSAVNNSDYFSDSFDGVVVGITWPVSAPFAFALLIAEKLRRRK